jgi:hypothetical protein
MSFTDSWLSARLALFLAGVLAAANAPAQEHAHAHGVVRLDVAVDARKLTLQLEAPLDSLLGFEHRPRTDAQRQAARALLERMKDVPQLLRPEPAAQCSLVRSEVEAPALRPLTPATSENEHSDLGASFEFDCKQPERLGSIEIGLFDAFKGIRRIDVRVATGKGQSKQTLKRPEKLLRLVR